MKRTMRGIDMPRIKYISNDLDAIIRGIQRDLNVSYVEASRIAANPALRARVRI